MRALRSGAPQLLAFAAVLLADRLASPQFLAVHLQDGRLFGSLVSTLR